MLIGVEVIYNVVLVSDVQHSDSVIHIYVCVCVCVCVYIYICIYFFRFFSFVDYYKILNIVPSALIS